METFQGIVLAERSANGQGKYIDILTQHNTVQEIYVRNAKKITSGSIAATQQFAYGNFSMEKGKTGWYLVSAEPIRIFYRLRESLTRLSLAVYFCELVRFCVKDYKNKGEQCEVLRLMLNTLHYLENGTRSEAQLKAIFELRLMTEIGMMPNVVACCFCYKYLPKQLYFSVKEGCFCCTECDVHFARQDTTLLLSPPTLQAMRHIVFAPFDRLYNFQLGEENMRDLQQCAEAFSSYHIGQTLRTLRFYHEITENKF